GYRFRGDTTWRLQLASQLLVAEGHHFGTAISGLHCATIGCSCGPRCPYRLADTQRQLPSLGARGEEVDWHRAAERVLRWELFGSNAFGDRSVSSRTAASTWNGTRPAGVRRRQCQSAKKRSRSRSWPTPSVSCSC